MISRTRTLRNTGLVAGWLLLAASCGGDSPGSSSSGGGKGTVSAASNVVPVIVDAGPTADMPASNTLYTTVTICVPGSTTQCQTVDHIQVDTESFGLRVLASVLTLALPITNAVNGNYLLECATFGDGYSWGPIATADLQVSGETASKLPIQVIGDPNFSAIPDACANSGVPNEEDTVATFGANGILGIGFFEQDCGSGCVTNAANGIYYACDGGGDCLGAEAPLASQVLNPVPLFAADNNGSIISLPSVAGAGAATVTGSLIFGIDTQSNNASGTQTILTVDPAVGYFTTVFAGQTLPDSIIDSGSNATYFNDSIATCPSNAMFYCPASTQTFSASLTGTNGVSATASFSVGNAESLSSANPTFTAIPSLAGTYTSDTQGFDWGLPFFFGRRVAFAIENHSTAVDTGPYVAF